MPRPRRAAEGGLIYHAPNRATARPAIFVTDEDYGGGPRVRTLKQRLLTP